MKGVGHASRPAGTRWLVVLGLVLAWPGVLQARAVDNAWEMPPLTLTDIEGRERNLHDWAGRVILLNFWATWCGPCRLEIPELIRFQERYGPQGLQVVSVGIDEARKLRNYARSIGINYPVLVVGQTRGAELLRRWGDRAGVLPFTVVIGRDGHLVFMRQGIFDREAFATYVAPLLQVPEPKRE